MYRNSQLYCYSQSNCNGLTEKRNVFSKIVHTKYTQIVYTNTVVRNDCIKDFFFYLSFYPPLSFVQEKPDIPNIRLFYCTFLRYYFYLFIQIVFYQKVKKAPFRGCFFAFIRLFPVSASSDTVDFFVLRSVWPPA